MQGLIHHQLTAPNTDSRAGELIKKILAEGTLQRWPMNMETTEKMVSSSSVGLPHMVSPHYLPPLLSPFPWVLWFPFVALPPPPPSQIRAKQTNPHVHTDLPLSATKTKPQIKKSPNTSLLLFPNIPLFLLLSVLLPLPESFPGLQKSSLILLFLTLLVLIQLKDNTKYQWHTLLVALCYVCLFRLGGHFWMDRN